MTEKDIQKISEEYKDEKAPLYEKLHARVEEMIAQQAKKRKRLNTFYKVFPIALAVVLIISVAVVLPIVLQPEDGEIWYSYNSDELDAKILGETLKDYAIMNNEKYLYIDLYEIADELVTRRYYKKDDERVTAYLQEYFIHGETGHSIMLSIMKKDTKVDKYENFLTNPKNMTINSVDIVYATTSLDCKAQFEYGDYKYYLQFDDAIKIEFLEDIISNMFGTEQATA